MSSKTVLKTLKDKNIEFVDLRFTDPRGKLQHLTMDTTVVDEDMLEEGVFFDGSSIAGWKAINESDMILKPDLTRPIIDPFNSHNTLNIFCDVLDAVKKDPYERDPRGTAKKAEAYLKKSGIGDKAYAELGEENCDSMLLNSPGNFTASKLAWVRENEPDVFAKVHKFMLPGCNPPFSRTIG